jgi:hypothetical protein
VTRPSWTKTVVEILGWPAEPGPPRQWIINGSAFATVFAKDLAVSKGSAVAERHALPSHGIGGRVGGREATRHYLADENRQIAN